MGYFWWGYWWLIFPVGFLLFGAWDRWLDYQRSRHRLEVMKEYAAQGKEPPPELARQVRQDVDDDDDHYGPRGRWPRHYRRYWRYRVYGRYWQWRGAVINGAIATAFWFAAEYHYIPAADGAFRFLAVLLGCLAVARLALALISMGSPDR